MYHSQCVTELIKAHVKVESVYDKHNVMFEEDLEKHEVQWTDKANIRKGTVDNFCEEEVVKSENPSHNTVLSQNQIQDLTMKMKLMKMKVRAIQPLRLVVCI